MSTPKDISVNYMSFIEKFHERMIEQNFTLVYEGDVTQDITKAFASLAQQNMERHEESTSVKKKVFHVMVECLQNITKHTSETSLDKGEISGSGIFIVGKYQDQYSIITGNMINNEGIPPLKEMLNNINELDRDGIKKLYKEKIMETRLSDKGGAGLGFIDIAKKTGEKLEFHFEPVNDEWSFFVLKTKVARES